MCGLAAVVDLGAHLDLGATLAPMLRAIVHRGPDDSGTAVDGRVGLGFRRLSILDLSPAGHQPMASQDGRHIIVFNGEIYNYVELRKELTALGHHFSSTGDTEVLLAAYRQWGVDCLRRLNGMWAFVIHDRKRQLVFGARDRFGIKPLYRCSSADRVLFASEIKAIVASGLYQPSLNMRRCAAYLHQERLDDTAETFFEGIQHVPAAHAFELDLDGAYREWPYWRLGDATSGDATEPPAAFAQLFEDAMRLNMRSDVPVGVNLSGGLDSTSIICAAARLRREAGANQELLAFCYQDKRFDESSYIADTLAQTGARLVPLTLTPMQLWRSLPRVLAFQDEPLHSMTALVGFHLMALAAEHGVKVILNGQGADEVIGGYGSYFRDRWVDLLRRGRWPTARHEMSAHQRAHGGSTGERMRSSLTHLAAKGTEGFALRQAISTRRRSARARARIWLRPELLDHLPAVRHGSLDLNDVLARAVTEQPLPLYLRVEDRNSMAHSVEVRVPFLDHRLVEFVFGLDGAWKLNGPWNKFVLREAMRGRIPESVRTRVDKMGFPTDAAGWLRGPLFDEFREALTDPGFRRSPFFDADVLSSQLSQHRQGQVNATDRLFDAVQMHLWCGAVNQTRADARPSPRND